MTDSMERIMADADEVFRYSTTERPQERAHAYLERYQVAREACDTAMQRVCRHLVERAFSLVCDCADELAEAMRSLADASLSCGAAASALRKVMDDE